MTTEDWAQIAAGFAMGLAVGSINWRTAADWHNSIRLLRRLFLDWRTVLFVTCVITQAALGVWNNNNTIRNNENTASIAQLTSHLETCMAEIQDVLITQSKLGRKSDRFALDVSKAAVIRDKIQSNPPPDIAPLSVDDPRRQAWFHQAQIDYWQTVDPLNIRREETLAERLAAPYPPPLCRNSERKPR